MERTMATDKQKITDWVNRLEDKQLLNKVKQLMYESYDAAFIATLSDEEKVAYWSEIGISGEELKKRLLAHINTLNWKK